MGNPFMIPQIIGLIAGLILSILLGPLLGLIVSGAIVVAFLLALDTVKKIGLSAGGNVGLWSCGSFLFASSAAKLITAVILAGAFTGMWLMVAHFVIFLGIYFYLDWKIFQEHVMPRLW
jgi:hypothetical protein